MLFNSVEFLIFLPLVFALYWLVGSRHLRFQNLLVLVASYVFYGWWDWRFLGLIALSTVVDFLVGIRIEEASSNERVFEEFVLVSYRLQTRAPSRVRRPKGGNPDPDQKKGTQLGAFFIFERTVTSP